MVTFTIQDDRLMINQKNRLIFLSWIGFVINFRAMAIFFKDTTAG